MEGWKLKSLKSKSFANIQEMFDKAMKRVNNFVDYRTELVLESLKKAEAEVTEGSSKRVGEELEQENAKKQKMEDDKESTELKQCLEIIPEDGNGTTTITPTIIIAASSRPKAKVLVIHKQEQAPTPIVSSQQPSQVKDKGKGKMVKPEPVKKLLKKDQLMLDEELTFKLQDEEEKEERFAKEKAKQIKEVSVAWDDIQAKIDMRIEQYFLVTHYSLCEVILNGDSPIPIRVIDGIVQPVAPTTAKQRLIRKNELKARGTLLMALPD
nr:hypothetical protein [Tanacetum cinerariifolium]